MRRVRRWAASLLAAVLLLGTLPLAALAAEGGEDEGGRALVLDAGVRSAVGGATFEAELLFEDGTTKLVRTGEQYGGTNDMIHAGGDDGCLIGQWVNYREDSQGFYVLERLPQASVTNMILEDHSVNLPSAGTNSYTIGGSTAKLDGVTFSVGAKTIVIIREGDRFTVCQGAQIPTVSGGRVLYSCLSGGNGFLYIDATATSVHRADLFLAAAAYSRMSSDGTNLYYSFKGVVDGMITIRVKLDWEDEKTQAVINRLLQGSGNDVLLHGFRTSNGLYTANLDNWVRPYFGTGRVLAAGEGVDSVTAEGITLSGGDAYAFATGCKFFRADGVETSIRIVESTWKGLGRGEVGPGERYAFVGLTLTSGGEVSAVYWRMSGGNEQPPLAPPPEPGQPEIPVIPDVPGGPDTPDVSKTPSVELDKTTARVRVGDTVRINAVVTLPEGSDPHSYGYVWGYDSGAGFFKYEETGPYAEYAIVKGVKAGRAVIKLSVFDGSGEEYFDTCELTIVEKSSGGGVGGSSGGYDSKSSKKPGTVDTALSATPTPTPAATSGTGTSFGDVSKGLWAYDQITWAASKGIMSGYGNGVFGPDRDTTRQVLWMVLARLNGSSPADMAAACSWALSSGVSDGSNPGGTMSRQQMVTMLYRYAQMKGYATTGGADLSGYPDSGGVAGYAQEALSWAVANGIMGGTSDGRLNPAGTASRAHFAVFMQRFCSLYNIA